MLPKINRADTKTVAEIFKRGVNLQLSSFGFKYIQNTKPKAPRVSVVVSKNIAAKATTRNNLRRLGYQALGPEISHLPQHLAGVLIFKKADVSLDKAREEVKKISKLI